MSISSDLRTYADTALDQGKQVLDSAQAQLTDVTEQANGLVSKLTDNAIAVVDPYVTQAKDYAHGVTDRAYDCYSSVRHDRRVSALLNTAQAVSGIVLDTVTYHLVEPVVSLTARNIADLRNAAQRASSAPTVVRPKSKPARKAATKPAITRPANAKPAPDARSATRASTSSS